MLAAFNYDISQEEEIQKNGETVLFELAPVDPHSLIQDDYIQLRYAMEHAIEQSQSYQEVKEKGGYMVISLDQNKVGTFKHFYERGELVDNEKLLHYHTQRGQLRIVPNWSIVREDYILFYPHAKYGVFKCDAKGNCILVELADDKMQVIATRGRSLSKSAEYIADLCNLTMRLSSPM